MFAKPYLFYVFPSIYTSDDTSSHITFCQVWSVYNQPITLKQSVIHHISKGILWIAGSKSLVFVPLTIDEQVRAFALVLCSHERMVDILINKLLRSGHLGSKPRLLSLLGKEFGNLHEFMIVAVGRIDQLMYLYPASIGILPFRFKPLTLAHSDELAGSAQFVLRDKGEFCPAFC